MCAAVAADVAEPPFTASLSSAGVPLVAGPARMQCNGWSVGPSWRSPMRLLAACILVPVLASSVSSQTLSVSETPALNNVITLSLTGPPGADYGPSW